MYHLSNVNQTNTNDLLEENQASKMNNMDKLNPYGSVEEKSKQNQGHNHIVHLTKDFWLSTTLPRSLVRKLRCPN